MSESSFNSSPLRSWQDAPRGDSASHWRDLYVAAILEVDNSKLAARIEAAQEAINARLKENADQEEQLQLSDANFGLSVLHRERLAVRQTGTN